MVTIEYKVTVCTRVKSLVRKCETRHDIPAFPTTPSYGVLQS